MLRVVACVALDHNPLLVALAGVICALACLTYINMLGRAAAGHDTLRRAWIVAASVVFGCGVWATHFGAMIGFQPSVAAVYSLGPTAISLVLVIVGGAAASLAWVQGAEPTGKPTAWRALAGVLVGVSIAAMHFTGMEALGQAGALVFDFDFVVTSIVIGISLSVAAMLTAASRHEPWRPVCWFWGYVDSISPRWPGSSCIRGPRVIRAANWWRAAVWRSRLAPSPHSSC